MTSMQVAEPPSDIAALWEEALNEYRDVAKVDIRSALLSQRSVTSIMMDQQRQLDNFKGFRHDKGKLDKLRSVISSNADIIQGVAKHVADAASAAFPPSSALLTAFTFVMNASKHVSDDYDMIESFFGIMQSFLQRLSLLEHKIPPQRAFQGHLINVFSALLKLSALARSYCSKGRFLKWAKALVDGKDPDLTAAYGSLNTHLQRLESALLFQTLRTTIEISETTRSTDQKLVGLQGQMERSHQVQVQVLETAEQGLMVGMRIESGMQELAVQARDSANTSTEVLRRQDALMKALSKIQNSDNKEKTRAKAGASKSANFNRLKDLHLKNTAEGGSNERLNDIKFSYVERLFEWIEEDPTFASIVDNEERLLWVSGAAGMGKSQLAFQIYRSLAEKYSYDASTSVAWFPFDEDHPEMRSVLNMIKCCAIRAANHNEHYCNEALTVLAGGDDLSMDNAFTQLIEDRFPKDSTGRLILVLDGIDEVDDDEAPKLLEYLAKIKNQECRVQIIFTSGPELEASLTGLEAKRIVLDREKIAKDMRRFSWSRTKTLSRLRKLRAPLRKVIISRVANKADSFLYIDHTMRRLNALGREGPILKELDQLPADTTALYHTLLEECQRNRTPEDRELLRHLLAWLAYTKAKFTVAEANLLIAIIDKDNSISVEEELEGRLARLLRISGDRATNDNDDSSENEESLEQMIESAPDTKETAEDATNFLSFQERSLRAYFRQAIKDHPDGLRCSATEAQIIIFRTCSAILTMPNKDQSPAARRLVDYATKWALFHLIDITPEDEQRVTEENARIVIESIFNIFSNKNDSLKPLEDQQTLFLGNSDDAVDDYRVSQGKMLAALSAWAKRATRLPQQQLPYGILDWFRPLVQEPLRVCINLSRAHIHNWFSSSNIAEAYKAFYSAHTALREGRNLPELKQNPNLGGYFDDFEKGGEMFTERSYQVVASAFWDIVKTASSYQGIGMAMKARALYKPAVTQLNKGLDDTSLDDLQKFHLLGSKGNTLLFIGEQEEDEKQKQQYFEDALLTLQSANDIFATLDKETQSNPKERLFVGFNLGYLAQTSVLLGRYGLAYEYMAEQKHMKLSPIVSILDKIIKALKEAGHLKTILDIYKVLDNEDIAMHILNGDMDPVQEAAKRLNEGQYLLGVIETSRKAIDPLALGSYAEAKVGFQNLAADFARRALCDNQLAKRLLREIVDSPTTPGWDVLMGCNSLAEIFLEEFRLSKDPMEKKNALDETRKLFDKLEQVVPDFKAAESSIMVTISLMLGRLGPALEYSDRMHAAFRDCVSNLQDDTGANDADALRRLSRVLGCVKGFEAEASISLTCQMYVLDSDVHRKDKELQERRESESKEELPSVDESVPDTTVEVEHDGPAATPSIDTLMNGSASSSAPGTSAINSEESQSGNNDMANGANGMIKNEAKNEIDEGLLDDEGFSCNMCSRYISSWSQGSVYFCMCCIDCDLCGDCYTKKLSQENGDIDADWKMVCPQGHRHIKAPVAGWRGVEDGVMRIGAEKVPFKSWLAQLEIKWMKHWDIFWTDAETI